jgi:hypothetical protein
MSTQDDEPTTGISDADLPADLQPSDDNPLAQPLTDSDDTKSAEELDVLGGKTPEQLDGSRDETSEGQPDQSADESKATDPPQR